MVKMDVQIVIYHRLAMDVTFTSMIAGFSGARKTWMHAHDQGYHCARGPIRSPFAREPVRAPGRCRWL